MADQKELQIPVFTVWKNNVILKNIFLINTPPSSATQLQTQQQNHEISKTHQQFEETLVIGRHPDCDIRLEHPSISRFHLRIHSKPSSNYLSLTDLSSGNSLFLSLIYWLFEFPRLILLLSLKIRVLVENLVPNFVGLFW